MFRKTTLTLLSLLVILSFFLTGCLGAFSYGDTSTWSLVPAKIAPIGTQVLTIHTGTTIRLGQEAIREAPGTIRYVKDGLYLLGRPLEDGFAYTLADAENGILFRNDMDTVAGKFVNVKTMEDIKATLEADGWKPVGGSAICKEVIQAFSQTAAWITQMASQLVTFVIVIAPDPNSLSDPYYYWKKYESSPVD